jgi:hypothetical protein
MALRAQMSTPHRRASGTLMSRQPIRTSRVHDADNRCCRPFATTRDLMLFRAFDIPFDTMMTPLSRRPMLMPLDIFRCCQIFFRRMRRAEELRRRSHALCDYARREPKIDCRTPCGEATQAVRKMAAAVQVARHPHIQQT